MVFRSKAQLIRHRLVSPETLMPFEVEGTAVFKRIVGEIVLSFHAKGLTRKLAVLMHAAKRGFKRTAEVEAAQSLIGIELAYDASLVYLCNEVVLVEKMVVERLAAHARALKNELYGYALQGHPVILHQRKQGVDHDGFNVYGHMRTPFNPTLLS